jgi:EmrB/QacA subfamily drug resistance transporter
MAPGTGSTAGDRQPAPATEEPGHHGPRQHYRVTFAVLAVGTLAYTLMQSMVLPALDTIQHDLHTSQADVAWLLSAFLLSASVATPVLGRMGDMFGKEKMLVVTFAILAVGTVLGGLANTLWLLILARVIQGVAGAVFPLAFSIIRDEFPEEKVAGGIGLISTLLGIGSGVGIIIGGPVVQHLSYHWLFWIPLVMIVAATVATFLFLPESPVRAGGGINWAGAVAMSAWLVTGLLALSEAPVWGWTSPTVLGLFGITAVLIAVWIALEVRSDTPVVDMRMMRIPAVWSTNLAALLFGFGMYAIFIVVPEYVQTPPGDGYGFGSSVTQSGLFLAPFAVAMLLIAPLTARLTIAIGSKPLLIIGALFSAASYGFLAAIHTHPWAFYVASGLLGIGVAFGFASMANLIIEAVPSDQTGVATGMNTNIRSIGGALGSAIATSILVSHLLPSGVPSSDGYTAGFVVCAASLVVAALAALAIPKRSLSPDALPESHRALLGEAEVFGGSTAYAEEPG